MSDRKDARKPHAKPDEKPAPKQNTPKGPVYVVNGKRVDPNGKPV